MGLNAFAMYDMMTGKDRGNAEHNRRVEEVENLVITEAAEHIAGAAAGAVSAGFAGHIAGKMAGHAAGAAANEMRRRFR